MDMKEAIKERHSVRKYIDRTLEKKTAASLQAEIDACNEKSNLHIQLVMDEPKAFGNFLVHYGLFSGVTNYIALIGNENDEVRLGYYGERIALLAQTLGLNTCWVAATFGKGAAKKRCVIGQDEKLVCVIALGYGAVPGTAHKSKPLEDLYRAGADIPAWFKTGMEAAALAPTAMNQQNFLFTLTGNTVKAESTGGRYSNLDLGIVKYHFEIGAGSGNFKWV